MNKIVALEKEKIEIERERTILVNLSTEKRNKQKSSKKKDVQDNKKKTQKFVSKRKTIVEDVREEEYKNKMKEKLLNLKDKDK